MTTSETIFVFARIAGVTHPVGRYGFTPTESGPPAAQFRYGQSWLRDEGGVSFALDPVNLPLRQGPFTEPQRSGLFGPLADATPDAWGRRLIQLDKPDVLLSAPQWLLATGDDRVGCLTFSPSLTPPDRQPGYIGASNLERIASEFERIQRGEKVDPRYEQLYCAGKSLGGARPKAVVEFAGALWIAKFQKHDDEFDQCMAEHAAMCLARDCGIEVAAQPDMYPTQAIGIGKIGTYPSRANCVSMAGSFSLTSEQAEEVVERIADVVTDWRERFKSYGADNMTIERIARAFMDLRKSTPAPTP